MDWSDRNLVYCVGMIYKNRENQHVIDADLEQVAVDAQQIGDGHIVLNADILEMSQRDIETANICRQMAIRYRPKNLDLYICINNHETNSILNQNYGDSKITVYKENEEPLVLEDMDVRSYFNYEFEGSTNLLISIESLVSLFRRCQGPVSFTCISNPDVRVFDEPSETIVPSLKRLLTFLWEEASSRERKIVLRFNMVLDIGQRQELHQHVLDISPPEAESHEVGSQRVTSARLSFGGSIFSPSSQVIQMLTTGSELEILTHRPDSRRWYHNLSLARRIDDPRTPRAIFMQDL